MIKDNILTEEERTSLKSMALYWDEVAKRENTAPLEYEVLMVFQNLGTRILPIIARYIELTEVKDK